MQVASAPQSIHSYKPYPKQVNASDAGIIASDAIVKAYGKRHDVFIQGDKKRSVYQVESGLVCLYAIMSDGKRQIFDFAFPGDIIGLGASETYSYCAQTIGAARLKSMPFSSLYERAVRDPAFGIILYKAVSKELDATRDLMMTLGQLGALKRVATFLLIIAKRNALAGESPSILQLPMTRSDIADLLGLTIETVSRSLTSLRHRKLIAIIQNSEIRILDIERLRNLAELERDAMPANQSETSAVGWRH
ncbi:MAG TPA: helix-turn-helix domain-containing protein [Hyphomicrobiales bacterium]|nr:helix-turn-helix domain-containing protein [Hyphomicrobiales bacterium]